MAVLIEKTIPAQVNGYSHQSALDGTIRAQVNGHSHQSALDGTIRAQVNGHSNQVALDGTIRELHTNIKTLNVDYKQFFGNTPIRVDKKFKLNLSDLSYLPKVIE